jgi:hypothetical protein
MEFCILRAQDPIDTAFFGTRPILLTTQSAC